MAHHARTVLRQTQNHRRQRPGCMRPTGRLAFISDPMPGRTHDAHALKETGLLDHITTGQLIGDKGYIGLGMTPPSEPNRNNNTQKKKKGSTSQ